MKRLYLLFFTISLVNAPAQAIDWASTVRNNTLKIAVIGSVSAIAGYSLGTYLYNKYQEYKETKIADESADTIITLFTQSKDPKILRKKARLTNIRKRVVSALQEKLKNAQSFSSQAHQQAAQRMVFGIQKCFSIMDAFRTANPYEKEYSTASYLDKIIENNIVNSCIASAKPQQDCSAQELAQRATFAQRKKLVFKKLRGKINGYVLNALEQMLES